MLHLLDTADILLKLLLLFLQEHDFLLGKGIKSAVLSHLLNLLETGNPGLDGLEVRQHTAEPALVDIVHTAALSLFLDGLLGLLLRAYEENGSALGNDVEDGVVGVVNHAYGLLQVDDVDAVPLREDVGSHLGVPPAGLMTEVYACFEKLLH